ncbi:MAG: F0F1 ATP synthase subunit delta [Candidatus Dormibacteria bacterium]
MSRDSGGSAQRYAQAAFEVAREKGDIKGWSKDLDQLEVILTHPEVAQALENPRLDTTQRIGLVLGLAPKDLGPERANFLKLLVLGHRTSLVTEIREAFQAMVDEAEGRTELDLTVAAGLSSAEENALTKELAKKLGREVKVNVTVDPGIIGGLVIRQGDHVTDGSVRRRLAEMREELLAG